MNLNLSDSILARLRSSREQSRNAQQATPEADDVPVTQPEDPTGESFGKVPYLFVQSFEAGTIVPIDVESGRYSVTLEHGLGQTIYFADRPSRDVGITPTPEFLAGLGFGEDNPPNAALIIDGPDGPVISTVELFAPFFDPDGPDVTYEVREIDDLVAIDPTVPTTALATIEETFGAAHLFIDDCQSATIQCLGRGNDIEKWKYVNQSFCWNYATCIPCEPYGHDQPSYSAVWDYWADKCNREVSICEGDCYAYGRYYA